LLWPLSAAATLGSALGMAHAAGGGPVRYSLAVLLAIPSSLLAWVGVRRALKLCDEAMLLPLPKSERRILVLFVLAVALGMGAIPLATGVFTGFVLRLLPR